MRYLQPKLKEFGRLTRAATPRLRTPVDCDLPSAKCRSLGRFRAVGYYHLHRCLRCLMPLAVVALPTAGGSRYSRMSAFAQCLRNG